MAIQHVRVHHELTQPRHAGCGDQADLRRWPLPAHAVTRAVPRPRPSQGRGESQPVRPFHSGAQLGPGVHRQGDRRAPAAATGQAEQDHRPRTRHIGEHREGSRAEHHAKASCHQQNSSGGRLAATELEPHAVGGVAVPAATPPLELEPRGGRRRAEAEPDAGHVRFPLAARRPANAESAGVVPASYAAGKAANSVSGDAIGGVAADGAAVALAVALTVGLAAHAIGRVAADGAGVAVALAVARVAVALAVAGVAVAVVVAGGQLRELEIGGSVRRHRRRHQAQDAELRRGKHQLCRTDHVTLPP